MHCMHEVIHHIHLVVSPSKIQIERVLKLCFMTWVWVYVLTLDGELLQTALGRAINSRQMSRAKSRRWQSELGDRIERSRKSERR